MLLHAGKYTPPPLISLPPSVQYRGSDEPLSGRNKCLVDAKYELIIGTKLRWLYMRALQITTNVNVLCLCLGELQTRILVAKVYSIQQS